MLARKRKVVPTEMEELQLKASARMKELGVIQLTKNHKEENDHVLFIWTATVWYFNTMHFSWQGCDEHCRVCLGDFKVGTDDERVDYIEFIIETRTKTRRGAEWEKKGCFILRCTCMPQVNLCPCSEDLSQDTAVANTIDHINAKIWYKSEPLSMNSYEINGFQS